MTPRAIADGARSPALSPGLRTLIGLAASVIALAGLWLGRDLVAPLALAAVIVIICQPVRHRLDGSGRPRWLGTLLVVATAWGVLVALALLLVLASLQFVRLIDDYTDELTAASQTLTQWLHGLGLTMHDSEWNAAFLQPSTILGYAASLTGSMLSVIAALFFVFAYLIYMSVDAARYSLAETSFGADARPALARFHHFSAGVRRYYLVNAAFGATVAVVDGLALWALGVPAPIVWAVLAFVTNFIPNIGFVIGLIPPALLALVVGGWPLMVAVIVIYCAVNVVLQVLVQPKFVSDAVNLSLTLTFFSVIFWTFIIGPLGAVLAIPLTLLTRALLLEGDPGSRWLRWLSGAAV
ncbi:AI-2E family transporter [Microbacterium murale]|uniref:AI-2E family transporter n=1 Tax=Microbacterium murale TaxID=1081040 RepID=A0ABQ1RXQ4_9MICO|nr:AI-2E family transporter [Microbacterium murale]GGD81715.1 AI-2E family transporter [Microbacterium murale]